MDVVLDKANQYHQLPNGKFRRLAVNSEYIHRMQRRHFLLFDALPLIGTVAAVALAFYRPIGTMEVFAFRSAVAGDRAGHHGGLSPALSRTGRSRPRRRSGCC